MAIKLLTQVKRGGATFQSGETLTLSAADEAVYVDAGKAVYLSEKTELVVTGGDMSAPGTDSPPLNMERNAEGNAWGIRDENGALAMGIPQAVPYSSYSSIVMDFTNPTVSWSYTNATGALSKDYQRDTNYTLALTFSGAAVSSAQIRKGSLTGFTADPDDKMLTLDVYIPFIPTSGANGHSISVTLFNTTGYSGDNITFSFDSGYIRQGWNSLRMWQDDTNGAAGTGTLAIGAGKTVAGQGCNMASNIGYIEVNFNNMTGKTVYLAPFTRSLKAAKTLIMMHWDATGASNSDDVIVSSIAPMLARYGVRGNFTYTDVYDGLYTGSADDLRKQELYHKWGWDAMFHTTNHGGTRPGGTATVTLSRTSNVVTATWGVAHGIPNTAKWHAAIYGATPNDMNGVFEFTYASATTATYTAAGADGAGSGTITYSTLLKDVINDAGTVSQQICDHEIVDNVLSMRSVGYNRGSTTGAWPNNSCPDITATAVSFAKVGAKLARGISGGTAKPSRFGGLDNPFNFGSVEMGSGTSATTLTYAKQKLDGALGRGEHLPLYGHYNVDEKDPRNIVHVNANLEYAPGQGGNPNPPLTNGSYNGYWYSGTVELFIQYAMGYVNAGQAEFVTMSEFGPRLGIQ